MKTKLLAAVSVAALAAACGAEGNRTSSMQPVTVTSSSIVGGSLAASGAFPYVAFIYNNQVGYLCTGTLIDDFVVLTAAHCVDDPNPAHYDICGGEDPFGDGCYWLTGAAEVHAHPQYDEQQLANDVGIIVLDAEPASQEPSVQPIPYLADDNGSVYDVGTSFTAVGFGVTTGTGPDDSGVKRVVQLSMTEIYQDIFLYGSDTKNTCSGDSGGPALMTIDGSPTVVGIVSFGDQNCEQFGGDSRTDYFASYIQQFAGAGATPTPTPNPGDDDDDDDGTTEPTPDEDGNEADDPWGNLGDVGCSIAGVTHVAGAPGAAFLGLIGLSMLLRRRRSA